MLDRILHCDCRDGLRSLPDACIPMTLTSPPYDAMRVYGGHRFGHEVFEVCARELWRLTAPGGVVAWVVADKIDGGYSGTSFRQALYFMSLGFRIHDILIMTRSGGRFAGGNRYGIVEFAFVFTKGRPRSVHLIRDKANKNAGARYRFVVRTPSGMLRRAAAAKPVAAKGVRGVAWQYNSGGVMSTRDRYAYGHPALMPEDMARDLILSWSRPGDLVLDPFCGSGTTSKMALLNHRRYLGFEVHGPYHEIAERKMHDAHAEYRRRLDASLSVA